MKLRKIAVLCIAGALVGGLGLALPATAGADTGYPGTTSTTTTPSTTSTTSTTSTSNPGNTSPGGTSNGQCTSTITVSSGTTGVEGLSGCTANSTFSITIAGVATGLTVTSDASGNITLTNVVTGDPFLSVNGSTPVSTVYGTNTVALTNASGGAGGTEFVIIPNVVTAALGTGSSSGTGGSGGAGGSAGTLAFTGADLLALIVGALFLLAMGTLLVVSTRRRASQQRVA